MTEFPRPLDLLRTQLANERTLLAYIRTSIGLVAAGVAVLHFFPRGQWGIIALAAGALTLVVGIVRYTRVRRLLG